jgi:LysM repeat protein
MGLFSFVTEAGSKLGSAVYDMLHKGEDVTKPVTIPPERLNELRRKNIESTIAQLGLPVNGLQVTVDGDRVTLAGSVKDQATCEKITLAAGNQNGIASVDCQLTVDNPTPEAQFYTVKAGDTLSKIAKEYYGSAGKYAAIFEANRPLLSDPDKIYPGQVLRIPPLN